MEYMLIVTLLCFPVCPLLSQANLFPAALVYFGSDVKTGLFTATSIFVRLSYLLFKSNDLKLILFTESTLSPEGILGNCRADTGYGIM